MVSSLLSPREVSQMGSFPLTASWRMVQRQDQHEYFVNSRGLEPLFGLPEDWRTEDPGGIMGPIQSSGEIFESFTNLN